MGADCLAVFTGCLGTVPGVGFLKVVAWVLPSVLSVGSGRRSLGLQMHQLQELGREYTGQNCTGQGLAELHPSSRPVMHLGNLPEPLLSASQ